jgi:hypothetical protein
MSKARFSPKAVIKDAVHFQQHSQISTGRTANDTSATHSVSLDLQDPEVKAAARQIFLKDPALAAEAVAEYPELAGYLKELGVPAPKAGQRPLSRLIPVPEDDDLKADSEPDEPKNGDANRDISITISDSITRVTNSSLNAKQAGRFSMVSAPLFISLCFCSAAVFLPFDFLSSQSFGRKEETRKEKQNPPPGDG